MIFVLFVGLVAWVILLLIVWRDNEALEFRFNYRIKKLEEKQDQIAKNAAAYFRAWKTTESALKSTEEEAKFWHEAATVAAEKERPVTKRRKAKK